jgi:azurin
MAGSFFAAVGVRQASVWQFFLPIFSVDPMSNGAILRRLLTTATHMKNWIIALTASCLTLPAFSEEKKIELTGSDQMQFGSKALEATVGDTVVLTLKHIGALPKAAMGHNFVLLKPDTKIPEFALEAMKAVATEHIPADEASKKAIIAHTKMVGGGESDTVTFAAPTEPGAYPYICTFPGHYAIMQGVLTVKAK